MKRKITYIALAVLILVGGASLVKNKVGDVGPALDFTSNNSADELDKAAERQSTQTGESIKLPLKVEDGWQVGLFAKGTPGARDLEFSPGGTLIVSLTQSGRVVALPDQDRNGQVDEVKTLIQNLKEPHGLAFYNGQLYVAENNRVVRYHFDEKTLAVKVDKTIIPNLPTGGHDAHTIVFDSSGQLFLKVGSSCNVCIEKDERRATILTSDHDGQGLKVYAEGLRNAPFMVFQPESKELWVTEMGRDWLGDNLPPDEVNIVKEGINYGWPNCYGNQVHDTDFDKNGFDCRQTEPAAHEFPAHSAPLGLAFMPKEFAATNRGNLLVAYHGSWNRSSPTGYKVVKLNVNNGKITGPEDFLTGFLEGSTATGRPVDLIFAKEGSLYISDDKAGAIYIVVKK